MTATPNLSGLCRRVQADDEPGDALRAITELRRRLDELERVHVGAMLAREGTWAEIGDALGITRQAAHHRHRDITRPQATAPSAEVSRVLVTSAARGTVRLARQEAAALGADAVGTEHLLLALTCSGTEPVARVLAEAGVDEQSLRSRLHPTVVDGEKPSEARGGFTPYAREVLEGSLREAVDRGDGFIAADHLLLALLRNPIGGAARTLDALGVDVDAIIAELAPRS